MAKAISAAAEPARPHTLSLDSRKTLSMTGVKEVGSFDEKQLVLDTEGGRLTVDGDGLHVTSLLLEEGRISIEGQVNAIVYSGKGAGGRRGLGGLLR